MNKHLYEILQTPKPEEVEVATDLLVSGLDDIGVELEYEQCPIFSADPDDLDYLGNWWAIEEDGSLRGNDCYEIKFNRGLRGHQIIQAIDSLFDLMDQNNICPRLSSRTSTHVHLGVGDLTKEQFNKLIVLYTIFESCLFRFVGENREKNPYCVPRAEALGDLTKTIKFIEEDREGGPIIKKATDLQRNKYSAMSAATLCGLGTLEFRHMGGCLEKKKLIDWINILLSLKVFARSTEIPIKSIPSYVSCKGLDEFIEEVFPYYADHLKYNGYEQGILDGVRSAQPLVVGSKQDFSEFVENVMLADIRCDDIVKHDPLFFNRLPDIASYHKEYKGWLNFNLDKKED